MPRYLISFSDQRDGAVVNGNFELPMAVPIRGIADVEQLQEQLVRLRGLNNPMIMGFSRFAEEDER